MKKLCGAASGGGKRGKIHPCPIPTNPDHYLTLLAALPAAILALTAALTAEDREVLAYLISCGGERRSHLEADEKASARRRRAGGVAESPPPTAAFGCSCFHCYTGYWARWDASPNRQLIHEIIEALEEKENDNFSGKKVKSARRGRPAVDASNADGRGGGGGRAAGGEQLGEEAEEVVGVDGGLVEVVEDGEEKQEEGDGEGEERRSSVRRLASYLGERIWGVWSL